jgi:Xaa-Pro dipeptidase
MDAKPIFKPYGFNKEKFLRLMHENGLRGVLFNSPENVYYTTGYTGLPSSGNPILYSLRNQFPYFSFIRDDGVVTLICWGYSTFGVEFGADKIRGFANFEGALETLEKFLSKEISSDATLGIESTCPYYVLRLIEEKINPKRLFEIDSVIKTLRLIKSKDEQDLIRKSTEIIETTLKELYDCIHIGMSRLELMQEAKTRLFRNGASGISHLTFSFGKANPEIGIDETLDENRLATLDLGGIYKGYVSDNRRYVYTGDIPEALSNHYNLMVEIVDGVGETLHPGKPYSEVYQTALKLFEKNGIELRTPLTHVGHNMGLETEEQWITNNPEINIEEGMVINIELYSMAPTADYIGDEETFLIHSSGPERISVLPREIRTAK